MVCILKFVIAVSVASMDYHCSMFTRLFFHIGMFLNNGQLNYMYEHICVAVARKDSCSREQLSDPAVVTVTGPVLRRHVSVRFTSGKGKIHRKIA